MTEIGFTRIKPGKKLAVIDSQYRSEKRIIKIDSVKIDVKKKYRRDSFTISVLYYHYNIVDNYLLTVNYIKSNYIKS